MLSGSSGGAKAKPIERINMPVVFIETDKGTIGTGFAWNHMGGSQALKSLLTEDVAPLLIGEDPLNHERLWHKIYRKLQSVGRAGLVTQAQAAVDLALWDIKGKDADMPVWQLLGGMRDRAAVYGSDGGWLYMTVDEMLDQFETYLSQGMMGVKMKVGNADPQIDIDRVSEVRARLGKNVWLTVDANQQWDFNTALLAGRAFEKLDVAWFEEPCLCDDIQSHARLADKLNIPIALGETLASRFEFMSYINSNAVDIVQPDIIRAGGITECVKIITLAEMTGRSVAPHHMMEASIHLICGSMKCGPVEFMPWIASAFTEPMRIEDGHMLAPRKAGLGLEIPDDVIAKHGGN